MREVRSIGAPCFEKAIKVCVFAGSNFSVNFWPEATVKVLTTTDALPSRSVTSGPPPKHQPVPVVMSTPRSSRFAHGVVQHLHPLGREIRDVSGFPTFRAVDGDDMNAAITGRAITGEFAGQIG